MEPFALSQKLEDLSVAVHRAVAGYPKTERFALAKETTMSAVRASAWVARANACRSGQAKLKYMEHADEEVAALRILIRLATRLDSSGCPYLSIGKYGQLAVLLDEVGRMIGGWIKSAAQGRG